MSSPSLLVYDVMTCLYAISVAFYFLDYLYNWKRINRIALGFLGVVWLLQTLFFVVRLVRLGYIPLFTTFEATVFFSWLLITIALIVHYWLKLDLFAFFVNLVGFGLLVFDVFTRQSPSAPEPILTGHLLVLHVGTAFLSYAGFAVSFIASVMYLIAETRLKQKQWTSPAFQRFPALDQLDEWSYRFVAMAFPLLLVAMILGAVWSQISFGRMVLWDPKPIASAVVFVVYGIYLYLRVSSGWDGRRMAWWNVGSFAVVLLNYFVIGTVFHTFHRW